MSDERSKAELIAQSAMAQSEMERMQSYLTRGRRYEALTEEQLATHWIESAQAWGANPFVPAVAMDDGTAEYTLRGTVPPYDLARVDLDRAFAAITARTKQMTEDEMRRANDSLVEDHEKATRSRN